VEAALDQAHFERRRGGAVQAVVAPLEGCFAALVRPGQGGSPEEIAARVDSAAQVCAQHAKYLVRTGAGEAAVRAVFEKGLALYYGAAAAGDKASNTLCVLWLAYITYESNKRGEGVEETVVALYERALDESAFPEFVPIFILFLLYHF